MPWHPERPERLLAIEQVLGEHDWLGWERREAPLASEAELELVHSSGHVAAIRELCARGGGAIDADTYAVEASWAAARRAAGGAGAMVRALVAGEDAIGFCGTRPAGHHAERERAMGFCLFDNLAVAAELAIRELGVERVFVVDWDVHHGNGTAEIFRRRDDVLVANIHQSGIFPGTGPLSDVGSGAGRGLHDQPAGAVRLGRGALALAARAHRAAGGAGLRAAAGPGLGRVRCATAPIRWPAASWRRAPSPRWPATCATSPPSWTCRWGRCWRAATTEALAECVLATLAALGGEGEAVMAAPEALLTSRAAAQIGHYWEL